MTKLLAIARRDIAAMFVSPIAYVVIAIYAFILGGFFVLSLADYQKEAFQLSQQAAMSPDSEDLFSQVDIVDMIVVPVVYVAAFCLWFLVPLITMRLFAEEKKVGTDELLLTAPLTTLQIVLGKYLAALAAVFAAIGVSMLPIACLFLKGTPPWKVIVAAYVGLILIGATYAAFGLLVSALTQNQIIAAAIPMGVLLLQWILGEYQTGDTASTSSRWKVISYLCTSGHFEDFLKGIVDTSHVVYFVSACFLGCFLTARVIDSSRWR